MISAKWIAPASAAALAGLISWSGPAMESAADSVYVCRFAPEPPRLDGKPDEACWTNAYWRPLSHKVGADPEPLENARAAFLWDDLHLFFVADVDEAHAAASLQRRDEQVFQEDCIELFLDPRGLGRVYYELEFSPRGTIWDSINLNEIGRRLIADNRWSAPSLEVRTCPRPGGWRLEGRIRFDDMAYACRMPPQPDDQWRLNVCRCNTLANKRQIYSAWFPTDNFNNSAKFGMIRFENDARKMELAERKEAARRFLSAANFEGWQSLGQQMAALKVDSTEGQPFTFTASNQYWRSKAPFGRFGLAQGATGAVEWLTAHPVGGFESTRVTWAVTEPCKLMVFARLGFGGFKAIQLGLADGTHIRVCRASGGELGRLHVVDTDNQMMTVEMPRAGDVVLTVEGGPAGSTRSDGINLAIYQSVD